MKEKIKAQIVVREIEGQEVKIIKLAFHADLKAAEPDASGKMIIEGYASVFGNLDSYFEIVDKGAFNDFLRANFPRYPKLIWAHNWEEPIGITLEAREDEHGLFVRGELTPGVQRAEEAYKLIKAGAITDLSFGFRVDEDSIDQANGARHLTKISIYEWSPVLVGANGEAQITNVKSILGRELTEEEIKAFESKEAGEEKAVPAEGDACMMPDGTTPGTMHDDGSGNMVCVMDNGKQAEPEKPANEPAAPAEPGTASDEAAKAAAEAKAGRVLSAANVKLVQTAITSATDLISTLEALLKAAEDSTDATGENTSIKVGVRFVKDPAVKAFLRDARKAKGQIERIIVRAKNY